MRVNGKRQSRRVPKWKQGGREEGRTARVRKCESAGAARRGALTRSPWLAPSPTNCVGEGINVANACGARPQVRREKNPVPIGPGFALARVEALFVSRLGARQGVSHSWRRVYPLRTKPSSDDPSHFGRTRRLRLRAPLDEPCRKRDRSSTSPRFFGGGGRGLRARWGRRGSRRGRISPPGPATRDRSSTSPRVFWGRWARFTSPVGAPRVATFYPCVV
jgi:hypothetical protein